MQIRCNNCFELYEDFSDMCPHCGYIYGENAAAAYYLKPGTKLKSARYSIGQVAGQGGFGIVYKAWDFTLQRVVAIKEFFPSKMVTRGEGEKQVAIFSSKRERDYETHLNRFRREAQIMSKFSNTKNSIDTYDVFEENGTAYIVMEYIDSPTLKDVMKARNKEPLPEEEAIDYATQMLDILEVMHAQGVYHLDVALDNIFVREKDGKKELIFYDFGAARTEQRNRKVAEEELIVKLGFAAPEQYKKNEIIGSWSDVYAVGANLYYMLTGVVPMEATDREHEDLLEMPAEITLVSPAINNAVMRAMAVNPELRYKSAKEFREELHKKKVLSLEEELKRRKRVRTRFLALCSAILVFGAIFLGYLSVTNGEIRECEITMWAVNDMDTEVERERYQQVIDAFHEFYPQITVNLEVMSSTELEESFGAIDKKSRPDLLETTYASSAVLDECMVLSDVLDENSNIFVSALLDEIMAWDEKSVPLGMYASVIYMQGNSDLASLEEVSVSDFLNNATGYVESDTTVYAEVQENVAGRYEVVESAKKQIVFEDVFSICSGSWNEKRAAKALLSYMLTDSAQETLHLTNNSNYLPISEAEFDIYVENIFQELSFLKDTISQYTLESRR